MVDVSGVVTLLVGAGAPAAVLALLRLQSDLRKLRADTVKVAADTDQVEQGAVAILSTTALAQMTAAVQRADRAEQDVERLRTRLEQVEADCSSRMDTLEAELGAYRDAAQEHVAWDWLALERAQAAGVTLNQPPPLLPPRESSTPQSQGPPGR